MFGPADWLVTRFMRTRDAERFFEVCDADRFGRYGVTKQPLSKGMSTLLIMRMPALSAVRGESQALVRKAQESLNTRSDAVGNGQTSSIHPCTQTLITNTVPRWYKSLDVSSLRSMQYLIANSTPGESNESDCDGGRFVCMLQAWPIWLALPGAFSNPTYSLRVDNHGLNVSHRQFNDQCLCT